MSRHYFELRPRPLDQTTLLAADMMRHLHTRQYLGKVVVLCRSPFATMRVARKQWLKLARSIQRQRASTIDADKILRRTYLITHMQHMQFVAKSPLQQPDAHVFFVTPDQLEMLPLNCFTLYIADSLGMPQLKKFISQLAHSALLVDYTGDLPLRSLPLAPKVDLEAQVEEHWQRVVSFLASHRIGIATLTEHQFIHVDALDNALDTLLSASHGFLRVASSFQHAFELAQPARPTHALQQQYNTVTLLAYRVQALTPGIMNSYSLRTYHEDETYFLHDIFDDFDFDAESIARHHQEGRIRLARAMASSDIGEKLQRHPLQIY